MSQWYWQSLVPQRWKKNLISKLKRVVYRELIHREISNKNNNEICDIKNIISVLVEKQLHVSFYSVFFVITTLIPSLVYFILKSNLSNCTKGFRGQTLPHTTGNTKYQSHAVTLKIYSTSLYNISSKNPCKKKEIKWLMPRNLIETVSSHGQELNFIFFQIKSNRPSWLQSCS